MKKEQAICSGLPRNILLKYLLIMKLTAYLLLIGCIQVSAKGFTQEKMDVSLKDVKLKKAINYIQKISGYRFVYNDDLVPDNKKVSVEAKSATIQEVLSIVLRGTELVYHILDNNLVVLSESHDDAVSPAITISGIIRLKNKDGTTVAHAGVSVLEKGTSNGTTTDESGQFALPVKDADAVLQVSYVGYLTVDVPLNGRSSIQVEL